MKVAGRLARLTSGVIPVLLTGMHLLLGPAAEPARDLEPIPTVSFVSSPRESLPLPIHDEATCAFCQAAAFAPHSSAPATSLAVAAGDEQRVHLTQDTELTHSGSVRPPRSRAPPVFRSV
jgi:hypothetical protein